MPAALEKLRKDPYRLFFPLGVLLGWVGVGQWLWFSLGLDPKFRIIFHAMVQVQGFLGCFVAGFLFTFIPRRTGSQPPALWQLGIAALCPLLLAIFAWNERWAIAQSFWLLELGVLLQFVLSRARPNPARLPPPLIWIPVALLTGLIGAVVTAFPRWHDLGRALVLEGVLGALVIGVGAVMVPIVTRSEPPSQTWGPPPWLQVLLAAIFIGSFVLQSQTSLPPNLGWAIRLGVVLLVLVWGARLWRWPTQPGLNRRVVFAAAWCVPLGYGLLALAPQYRSAGLHVVFIGGFGLLALSIGQHVIASHAGEGDWIARWPRRTWGVAGLIALALGARVAMQLDPGRYLQWMTAAALAFVAAGACWLWGMAPLLRGRADRA